MTASAKTTLDVTLADSDHESLGTLPVRIVANDFTISLFPKGYGDFSSVDGSGCPMSLEFYQGHLRLIVFPEINSDDPTIIDLSSALETRRKTPK